ncbi:MAG: monovalent cation/H(+) antiporter subunit G [Caldicoprobacterales bacterium]|jgi:multicomponent Na+:H+ antiporter subunit G|nr:cation:proton antiporter [Clostridiales bacterium]
MIKIIAYLCFLGSFIAFGLGTLGLFRLPDAYSRMHAAGIGDTLGIGLLGLGAILLGPSWILRLKILIILFLFWIVNPTMTHLIAKAALIRGTQPTEETKLRRE